MVVLSNDVTWMSHNSLVKWYLQSQTNIFDESEFSISQTIVYLAIINQNVT